MKLRNRVTQRWSTRRPIVPFTNLLKNLHYYYILPEEKSTLRLPSINAGAYLRPELRPRGSELTLHFDRLSVLSLPKEAALLHPAFKGGVWRRRRGQEFSERFLRNPRNL